MKYGIFALIVLFILSSNGWAQAQSDSQFSSIKPYLVALSVTNLDSTIRWYTYNIGFTVIKKMDLPKYSLRIAFLELNGFQLEVIEFKGSVPFSTIKSTFPEVDDRAKVQGFNKLAFSVDSVESIARQLKNNQVTFIRDVTDDPEFGVKFILVEDNDRNIVQFFQKLK